MVHARIIKHLVQFPMQDTLTLCAGVESERPHSVGSQGCDVENWSYAQLILDMQERGATGVVFGTAEGSDVFQLECRRADF